MNTINLFFNNALKISSKCYCCKRQPKGKTKPNTSDLIVATMDRKEDEQLQGGSKDKQESVEQEDEVPPISISYQEGTMSLLEAVKDKELEETVRLEIVQKILEQKKTSTWNTIKQKMQKALEEDKPDVIQQFMKKMADESD